jgi:hypothetical protein
LLSASFSFPFFCSMNHNHAKPMAGGYGMMGGQAFTSMDSGSTATVYPVVAGPTADEIEHMNVNVRSAPEAARS